MTENIKFFNGLILEKSSNGEITERREKVTDNFINLYQTKLAVLDDDGKPFGEIDNLLITKNPENLLVKDNDNQTSIELMSKAIKEISDKGFNSIAISTDTLTEIEEVREEIAKLIHENQQMQKVGFYYPDTE